MDWVYILRGLSAMSTTTVAAATVTEGAAPLVTCIMPTCDRHCFVPEAIRCFLRQNYPNLELVIVDDGSRSVASLLPDDPRVRLIRLSQKKNIGAKRNIACAAAHGEFILHWDDDDWYPPDRVSRQVAASTNWSGRNLRDKYALLLRPRVESSLVL